MRKILLFLLFILLIACSEEKGIPLYDKDGKEIDSAKLKELEFQRVQDSILKNYSGAVKLINQIDSELSKLAQIPETSESYNLETEILQKIDYLSFQLKSQNEEIRKLELQLKSLAKDNKANLERIKTLEAIIAEKDVVIANQIERIGSLEGELATTKTERDVAVSEKITVEKFAMETVKEKNTAFYVIGREKNLLENNIIKMEGEGFLGIGGKYITSPDAELKFFTKIDITKDTLIPFPSNSKIEEVVSAHSRRLLEIQAAPSGTDYLRIRSPESFWRTDRMLIIIVEDK
jgi:hypothetical protein